MSVNQASQPILFEVFNKEADECQGLEIMSKIEADFYNNMKNKAKNLIGDKGVSLIKKIKSK